MAWYETFFDEHYLKGYAKGLTLERTQKEADFIKSTLNLPQVAPNATGGRGSWISAAGTVDTRLNSQQQAIRWSGRTSKPPSSILRKAPLQRAISKFSSSIPI